MTSVPLGGPPKGRMGVIPHLLSRTAETVGEDFQRSLLDFRVADDVVLAEHQDLPKM